MVAANSSLVWCGSRSRVRPKIAVITCWSHSCRSLSLVPKWWMTRAGLTCASTAMSRMVVREYPPRPKRVIAVSRIRDPVVASAGDTQRMFRILITCSARGKRPVGAGADAVQDWVMTSMTLLNEGHQLPTIGFGTYSLRGEEGIAAIVSALEVGCRLLDT